MRSFDSVSYPSKVSLVIIVLILLCSCATPRPWTKDEKIAAGYFCLAHFADAYTTERHLDDPHPGTYEINPVLGKYPSDSQVTIYFSLTGAAALLLGHFWPDLRKPLFISYGTLNAGLAVYNTAPY